MLEFIKYLSPVALLGLTWAVVQYYQKRKHSLKDKKNDEKKKVFKNINSVIIEIDFNLIRFISDLKILILNGDKSLNDISKSFQTLNKNIKVIENQIYKIDGDNGLTTDEIKDLKLKFEDYNRKHVRLIENRELLVNKVKKETNTLFDKFILSTEEKIKELNKISTLGFLISEKLEGKISSLTYQFNFLRESFKTDSNIDVNGMLNLNIRDDFNKIFEILRDLKKMMNKDII
ncbi:hypothetical protein [Polaribacter marinaquae]|uniref:Uncharacterized protein n=1 Tax=Polaribacter marinaquae TaxID=1642819 RepID=A0ABZ2TMT8_9FLAO